MADCSNSHNARALADAAERDPAIRCELFLRGRYEGVAVPETDLAETDRIMAERHRRRAAYSIARRLFDSGSGV